MVVQQQLLEKECSIIKPTGRAMVRLAMQFWQIESALNLQIDMLEPRITGAVSWQSGSFSLILPISRPQSLWNLK